MYKIDGETAVLVGWRAPSLEGDVVVPALVTSGVDSYAVTSIGEADASEGVFAGSSVESVSLPASVMSVADGALSDCPTLASVAVGTKNESLASFDGMLFTKDLSELLSIPEGKEGVARIPDQTVTVSALSHCAGLAAVEVGEGNAAFSSRDGLLYTKDMNTLVACPVGSGGAVVLPEGVESIAAGALAGCAVSSITALGFVRDIAADAFDAEARAGAVVALPAGDDYEARKAVWVAAGFSSFKEPAKPGDVSQPEPSEGEGEGAQVSGLAYEVLDDYTLAVSWQGAEGPEGHLEIPATAEVGGVSYRVSAIADAAFAGRTGLTGVTLPASVTAVGERAFEATGVTEAWLPASVATVGDRAFAACASLSRVVALGSPWVADSALAECSGVSVYAPSGSGNPWNVGLPAAGNHLLPYGVDLPEEPLQLEVGQSADLLENGQIDAPDPVETSYSYAAKPLSVDPDGTATGKAEGSSEVTVALSLDNVELARASRAVEVAHPVAAPLAEPVAGASEVVDGDLAYVLLDDGTLGVKAVEPLAIEEALIPSKHAYSDKGSLPVTKILANGFAGGPKESKLAKVVLPNTITEIGSQAFQGCLALRSITLPASVAVIGQHALRNCTSMTSIEVDARNETFSSSEGILYSKDGTRLLRFPQGRGGSFAVPDGVVSIGNLSFYGVPVTSVDLPGTLQTIEDDAFAQCGDLTSIDVPDSVTSVGARAFYNNVSLERAKLPRGLQVIDGDLFYGDARLATVVMPEAYRELGVRAFGDCASLESLTIPSSVRSILAKALENCTGLKTLDIQTTEVNVVEGAFFGCSALKTVYAYDALPDSGMAAAFDAAEKTGAYVLLPQVAASGATYDQMAAAWGESGFGFAHVSVTGGDLPMVNDEGAAAWRFEPNSDTPGLGTLIIEQTAAGKMATLGWAGPDFSNVVPTTGYWSPLREAVSKVVMRSFDGGHIRAEDAANWFSGMTQLVDASQTHVPLEITSANFMYNYCMKLTSVPDDLTLPDTVTSAAAMFRSDPLELFPTGLKTLSKSIVTVNSMFAGTKFSKLPEDFTLEGFDKLVDAGWMFAGSELTSLPSSFRIPSDVSVLNMFDSCSKLTSLPEGFVMPTPSGTFIGDDGKQAVKTIEGMFRSCTSLTYLPASFDFASIKDVEGFDKLFNWKYNDPPTEPIQTYYAGTLPADVSPDTWSGRHIRDAAEGLPAGAAEVSCLLPNADGSYPDQAWAKVVTDASGKLSVEPQPAERDGFAFVGWYVDKACTQKFDFTKSVTAQGGIAPASVDTLYAKFAATSGLLDTEDGGRNASWKLEGGTLYIDCEEGASIKPFGWNWNQADLDGWGQVRGLVERVRMSPTVRVSDMGYWFKEMPLLRDATGITVPEGTKSVYGLFHRCPGLSTIPASFTLPEGLRTTGGMFLQTSISSLPDSFKIPETVTEVQHMFRTCGKLESLPEGFRLPSGVERTEYMFEGCTTLKKLPEGFTLGPRVRQVERMFQYCRALVSLPEGFTLAGTQVVSSEYMFNDCYSLASLPEGFTIPDTVGLGSSGMDGMFVRCNRLTVLPDSFDFPLAVANASADPFKTTAAGTLTYYAGSSDAVKSYDWGAQNRKLVLANDPDNPLPDTMHLATFKVPDSASSDGWATYATSLTDAAGKVANPGDPARFGYPFQGWYADPSCTEPFDFAAAVTGDVVVFGKFGDPILRYEVPLRASVTLNADGSITPAALRFRSFTPQAVSIKAVSSQLGEGAAALVPQEGQRALVSANLSLGYTTSFPLDGSNVPLSAAMGAASSFYDPGVADGSLSLDFKGAQVSYAENELDDVARLAWTVGLSG
ncbi:leucine-rich repeat protein [Eggerthella timonensis]|uniref:leucine-rich repeat protein n=1 Tax=Eggerthella timonensis TaxID=1871008 RepID=UPI0015E0B50D|nr:leucine-rich repeat protein [Eggerthella timonensis]